MTRAPRRRRSELTTPAHSERMIRKAADGPADVVILDLEDACAVSVKEAARDVLVATARAIDWGGKILAFRPNPAGSTWFEADLRHVVAGLGERLDAVVLPKADGPRDVEATDRLLGALEAEHGLPPGRIALEVLIETPRAVEALAAIAAASPRTAALIFGVADYAALLGARLTPDVFTDYAYARGRLVNVARAHGLTPIDCVTFQFKDLARTRDDAARARAMGFEGKWCVHPEQVAIVNDAFTPSPQEVEHARRVVAAYRAADQEGRGAIVLDDEMVDLATVRVAERVLALAGHAPAP